MGHVLCAGRRMPLEGIDGKGLSARTLGQQGYKINEQTSQHEGFQLRDAFSGYGGVTGNRLAFPL